MPGPHRLDADVLGGLDALRAIVAGVHAIEISPFPYYLTEINLLLQVSRLLGALGHGGRDVAAFRAEVEASTAEVARLLEQGRVLVEGAERLVCALYALPEKLEDEVVSHAVARAKASAARAD